MGGPVPVGETEVENNGEAGICPDCGGRGNPCGSTQTTQFYNCEHCPETFSEDI